MKRKYSIAGRAVKMTTLLGLIAMASFFLQILPFWVWLLVLVVIVVLFILTVIQGALEEQDDDYFG